MKSRKQTLIDELQKRLDDAHTPDVMRRWAEYHLRYLRNRGSGPLPALYETIAHELGITS